VILDTSAYSSFLRGSTEIRRVLQLVEEVAFTPVIIGELWAGFKGGKREEENRRLLDEFLSSPRVVVRVMDDGTAECYATILDHLRRLGRPLPTNDLWIAASAMQHGYAVVTCDGHFLAIPQIVSRCFPSGG
jgi:predicted nucleic acid-binding protein